MSRTVNNFFLGFFLCFAASVLTLTISVSEAAASSSNEAPPALLELQDTVKNLFPNSVVELRRNETSGAQFLWLSNALDSKPISLEILNHEKPNAFAIPAYRSQSGTARIVLTTALIELLMNKSELAFVIAHEMAHLKADHFSPDIPAITLSRAQLEHMVKVHQSWEMTADKEAVEMLHRRGLDARAGLHLLGRLDEFEHNDHHSIGRNHPSISERLNRLNSQIAQILP